MNRKKVFIAGHNGMVGNAILRILNKNPQIEIICKSKKELNLTNQKNVINFLQDEKPSEVILAAAKVGGIYANNTYPAEFIYDNIQIQTNIIHGSHLSNVQKLLFLGSSCIYPKYAPQPMKEDSLLTGCLESTNEPYAIAKIAGIKMCESYNRQYGRDYRSVMPSNLYGPGDNYHSQNSHVIPALIKKIHNAKITNSPTVNIWGSGNQRREFLYVEDMARASIFINSIDQKVFQETTNATLSHINIGTGQDITIRDLAESIKKMINYKGDLVFDNSKPDGPPRKLLNISKLKSLGWSPSTSLKEGLELSYKDYLNNNLES